MSDEEVICTFMEPEPVVASSAEASEWVASKWWIQERDGVAPRRSTLSSLDALWEVEEKLYHSGEWIPYLLALIEDRGKGALSALVHASVTTKIKALASVLR